MTVLTSFPSPLRHELTQEQWEEILVWCAEQEASDIVLCPDDKIWMQKDGVWYAITDSCITDAEIQYMVNVTSGQSNRAGYVRAGHSLDYAFGLRVPGQRGVRQRFRVNATSSNKGIYVVLRILPRTLPVLEDMELADDLVKNLYPDAGLVVISGVMGSGKSTLLAAALNRALLPSGPARQILTLEDPIEFDFSSIPCQERSAPITQSAIGTDVEDWAGGVRTLTRRKGEIVMVGECRDRETISSLLSTVEQGVTAYTTVHAQDVAQTLTRIIHLFRKEERDSAMAVLFANIRLIIHQRLVPRKRTEAGKTGRIALREYLACDRAIRSLLYELDAARLIEGVRSLVGTYGHSLLKDAREKHARGLIDDDVLQSIVREQEGRKASPSGASPSPSDGPFKGTVQGPFPGAVQGSSQGAFPGTSQRPSQWPSASSSARSFHVVFQRPSGSSTRPSPIPSLRHSQKPVQDHFPGRFPGHVRPSDKNIAQGFSQASAQAPAQAQAQASAQPAKPSAKRPVRQHMAGASLAGSTFAGSTLAGASKGASKGAIKGSFMGGPSGHMPHAPLIIVQAVPAVHAAQGDGAVPVPGKSVPGASVPDSPVPQGLVVPGGPVPAASVPGPVLPDSVLPDPVLTKPVLTGSAPAGSGIKPLSPQSDSGKACPDATPPCPRPQTGSKSGNQAAKAPCPGPQSWPWQSRPEGPGSPAGCTA